jgi:hypothetical protein
MEFPTDYLYFFLISSTQIHLNRETHKRNYVYLRMETH